MTEFLGSGAQDTVAIDEEDLPVKSAIVNGWWSEWIDISMGGESFCIKLSDVLFREKSEFQDILIFKRSAWVTSTRVHCCYFFEVFFLMLTLNGFIVLEHESVHLWLALCCCLLNIKYC